MSVIQKFMAALDVTNAQTVTDALTEAVRACSDFRSFQDLIDHAVSDCRNASSGDAFLQDYCGINLYNADTGAITGLDAGGSVTKNASSVVPESGIVDRTFTADSFTVNGLTFRIGDESNTDAVLFKSFTDLSTKEKYIWQAIHSWWAKSALDLNAQSYGNNFSFTTASSAAVKEIHVYFINDQSDTYFANTFPYWSGGTLAGIDLTINTRYANSIVEGDTDGKFTADGSTQYFDRTFAHEMTHVVMAANLTETAYRYLPKFVREGIAEFTCGIDDKRTSAIQTLASNADLLQTYLSDMKPTNSATGYDNPYSAGYILFRYLNKQASILRSTQYVYTYSGDDKVISDYQDYKKINLATDFTGINLDENNFYVNSSSGTLTIQNARGKVISYCDAYGNLVAYSYMASGGGPIDAGSLPQYEIIIGANYADNQIYAGTGGSMLWGGVGGNDVLVGNVGYDEFFYGLGGGVDAIFNAGDNDLVNLVGVSGSQIANIDVNVGQVNFSFIDGGYLQVNGGSGVAYRIAEGTFAVNQYTKEWSVR